MDLLTKLSLPELLALQWTNILVRYFFVAGLTYLICWKWCFPALKSRFLYSEMPKKSHLHREIKFSVLSTLIFLLPTVVIVGTESYEFSKVYMDISQEGMTWYFLSFVVVFFLHDTYFYWTHRLMHTKALYRFFHKTHHLSVDPSPMAAFAFHPLEAMIETGVFLIIPLFMPVHWTVLFFFTLFSLFMNVYGHLGFTLFKVEKLRRFPLNLFSHSTHHSWHHRYYRGNYGFYLQFWDRLMGTWGGELPKKSD